MTQQTPGATIVISRKRGGWRDWARSYLVMLDDQDVGKIKRGERLELPVPAGPHELFLKIDWCQSRSFTFDARQGEAVEFLCEPGGTPSAGLRQVLSDTDAYIKLTRI
jgi:hypothetical protein